MGEQRILLLKSIYQKINNPQISLQEVKKICEKEGIATISLRLLREDKEEGELQGKVCSLVILKVLDYFFKNYGDKKVGELVTEKLTQFSDQELDLIEWVTDGLIIEQIKSISSVWDSLTDDEKKEINEALGFDDQNKIVEKLKKIKKSSEEIQGEKVRRQQTKKKEENQPDSNFPNSSNSSIENLQQTIKNLQDQLSNLQTQPTIDNSSELKGIEQSLNQLQNNLQNIEQKKKMDNSSTSHQEKQELTKLKSQIQQLQKDLQSKQTGEQKDTNSQRPKDFNWLYVVIPLGALTIILAITIAYLLGKKNKKE